MKRLLPLLTLGLLACAENFAPSDDGLGTVQGTVYDDTQSASGPVLIGLADMSGEIPLVVHSITVNAEELPHDYTFNGVDPDALYSLVAFIDAGEVSGIEAMEGVDRLEIAADQVRATQNGINRVYGINLAL